jgi:hypothetical protein
MRRFFSGQFAILSRTSIGGIVLAGFTTLSAYGQAPGTVAATGQTPSVTTAQPVAQEHPLVPALKMAYSSQEWINANLQDYSATLVKRERINGTLGEAEYALIKVRSKPFSVYMNFVGPEKVKGQECLYVEGQNNGKMFAHASPSTLRGKFGTVQIHPNSAPAMQNQRYPLTEIGIENLVKRLIEVAEKDKQYGECEVKFFQKAKVNGRECTVIQVMHPVPRKNFIFHLARVYVDDQLNIPIRYEAYDWPSQPGGDPVLLEEYTYMNVQINQGFTDADFDVSNAKYNFNVKR